MAGEAGNNGNGERRKINDPSPPYYLSRGRGSTGRGRGRMAGCHALHVGDGRKELAAPQESSNAVLHKPGFTDEEWQTLLKLMEKCKTTPTEEKLSGPTYEDTDWSG
ncbi:unnamed protein product [Cuscuta epithymum]|uniref:Uncharacterized protein n=1 Tax=Cuscuta epithymum TaxID=186058 RepID=A0AAV0D7Q8_9ASTE|nr:unnamed protein product [Cuscuta epithymum]